MLVLLGILATSGPGAICRQTYAENEYYVSINGFERKDDELDEMRLLMRLGQWTANEWNSMRFDGDIHGWEEDSVGYTEADCENTYNCPSAYRPTEFTCESQLNPGVNLLRPRLMPFNYYDAVTAPTEQIRLEVNRFTALVASASALTTAGLWDRNLQAAYHRELHDEVRTRRNWDNDVCGLWNLAPPTASQCWAWAVDSSDEPSFSDQREPTSPLWGPVALGELIRQWQSPADESVCSAAIHERLPLETAGEASAGGAWSEYVEVYALMRTGHWTREEYLRHSHPRHPEILRMSGNWNDWRCAEQLEEDPWHPRPAPIQAFTQYTAPTTALRDEVSRLNTLVTRAEAAKRIGLWNDDLQHKYDEDLDAAIVPECEPETDATTDDRSYPVN